MMRSLLIGRPALVLATLLSCALGFYLRLPCLGTELSAVETGTGCFNDLRVFWFNRGLAEHILPYVNLLPGTPGTIEYPVLTGQMMWVVSLPANSLIEFAAYSTVVMALGAVAISLILHHAVGNLAWAWAVSPTLIQYVVYNYDIPPTLCVVAAGSIVIHEQRRQLMGLPQQLKRSALAATALLTIGGALKLFPLLLLPPLLLWVLSHRELGHRRWAVLGWQAGVVVGLTALFNVPFAVVNWQGWIAPYTFQGSRVIDGSTLSIWAFVGQGVLIPSFSLPTALLMLFASVTTAGALLFVVAVSWRLHRRHGSYEPVPAMIALLAVYLLFNKVFSLQHLLWLLPMLLLLRPPVRLPHFFAAIDVALYWTYSMYWYNVTLAQPFVAKFWWRLMLVSLVARFGFVFFLALRSLTGKVVVPTAPRPRKRHQRHEPRSPRRWPRPSPNGL